MVVWHVAQPTPSFRANIGMADADVDTPKTASTSVAAATTVEDFMMSSCKKMKSPAAVQEVCRENCHRPSSAATTITGHVRSRIGVGKRLASAREENVSSSRDVIRVYTAIALSNTALSQAGNPSPSDPSPDLAAAKGWFEAAADVNPDWVSARLGLAATAAREGRIATTLDIGRAAGSRRAHVTRTMRARR
jgi:hypothetical protein